MAPTSADIESSDRYADRDTYAKRRQAVLQQVCARRHELASSLVEEYCSAMTEYRELSDSVLTRDVTEAVLRNIQYLVEIFETGSDISEDGVEWIRRSASRRAHQHVSLPSVLRAYRLCVSSIWRTIASYAGADDIGVRIAIEAADTTMAYLERVSSELTQSYLRASSVAWADSPALRTDVLETLLTGEPINEYARRQAAVLATSIRAPLLVVVLRVSEPDDPLTGVREALRTVRSQLSPQSGSFLFGARDTEVICICTLNHDDNGVHIEGIAHELAASGRGWAVGIGRISDGVSGIRRSYGEAREAVELSLSLRQPSRALRFADLLLDQILSSTRYTDALLEETVRPLVEYDRHKNADLLPTLRAYMRAGFNLTKAAAELTVNPNTVAYRLRRIHTLTRHDPSTVDDLLLLALGLKLYDNTQSL